MTSDDVSSRHEGNLGGRLLPFGSSPRVSVTVLVSDGIAHLASAQHTAWMLVNTLSRLHGVVDRVGVVCPIDVKLAGRIVPLAPRDLDLNSALLRGGSAINVVPVLAGRVGDCVIVVGNDNVDAKDLIYAFGSGWCGGISTKPVPLTSWGEPSDLPFGPYVAACIATGEVFKAARMDPKCYLRPASAFYSTWSCSASDEVICDGPARLAVELHAVLAGVGAVGTSCLHTLWACPGVTGVVALVDNDKAGVEQSNLNRYVLFGSSSVGRPKASTAADILVDASIKWLPVDSGIETFEPLPPTVISAVDTNIVRHAIQGKYPSRLFSGSTLDIRAEVLRCGPPGQGPCLACYNPPEQATPDSELRIKFRGASDEELRPLCQEKGLTLEEAREWLDTGKCGLAGERLLELLHRDEGDPLFAVTFVSAFAGTLLAAATLKDGLPNKVAPSEALPRVTFQFFTAASRANKPSPFSRDPSCVMCDPTTPAVAVWKRRYGNDQK